MSSQPDQSQVINDPKQNNNSSVDPHQSNVSVNISTLTLDKKRKKVGNMVLNENGRWINEEDELPIEVQIQRKQDDTKQNDEVIKKLQIQHKNLAKEVNEIGKIVGQKKKESEEEEQKRIKKQLGNVKRDQLEIVMTKLTPQEVNDRLKELEKELKNSRGQAKILNYELNKVKDQNEDKKVLDQIQSLEADVKSREQQYQQLQQEMKLLEKKKKNIEKQIESVQSDKDDAQKINRMTQELFTLKEKQKALQDKFVRDEENYARYEKLIAEMLTIYKANCEKLSIEPIELKLQYQQVNLEEERKDLKKKGKKTEKKDEKQNGKKDEKKDDNADDGDKNDNDDQNDQGDQDQDDNNDNDNNDNDDNDNNDNDDDQQKNQNGKKDEVAVKKEKEKKMKEEIAEFYRKKGVKAIREEKESYESLKMNLENYIRLETNLKKLLEYKRNQDSLWEKEKKVLVDKISDLQFEISSIQQYTKEKEKEKQLAESRYNELKKQVKHNQLEPIKKVNEAEKKKREQEQRWEKLKQKDLTKPKSPFSKRSPHQKKKKLEDSVEQTILDKLLDVEFRLSQRKYFGLDPDENTQICDDVNVVGNFSIEHRLKKILFFHNPKEGQIYAFQSEYLREDKKSTVTGQWQINEEMKKLEGTEQVTIEIADKDWVNQIEGEKNEKCINYLKITTQEGKQFELGKRMEAEKENKFEYKRVQGTVPVTLFAGFQGIESKEDSKLMMVTFGMEIAQKLSNEEKEMIRLQKEKEMQERKREEREEKYRETFGKEQGKK